MKKIYYSAIFSLASSLFSCSDFSNHGSLSELSNGNFWNTEADATKTLAGCYDVLLSEGSLGFCWPRDKTCSLRGLEFTTDNGYFTQIPWVGPDITISNTMSPAFTVTKAVWNTSYIGIARYNDAIEKVPQMLKAGKISEEADTRIACEIKFIRALFYSHLTSLYRDAPKVSNVLITETSQVPKSSKSEIIADIVKDLKDAIAKGMLPAIADRGCATRGAALGLLIHVYLYNEMCKETADAVAQVMSSGYIINPNCSMSFTEAGDVSKEIVFAIRFKDTDQQNGKGGFLTYNYGYPIEWQLLYSDLANDLYCKDSRPITSSKIYDPNNDSIRNPRSICTLMTKSDDAYDGKISDAW